MSVIWRRWQFHALRDQSNLAPNDVFVSLQDLLVADLEVLTQVWSVARVSRFTARCQGLFCCIAELFQQRVFECHSHSIVPGGLLVTS